MPQYLTTYCTYLLQILSFIILDLIHLYEPFYTGSDIIISLRRTLNEEKRILVNR